MKLILYTLAAAIVALMFLFIPAFNLESQGKLSMFQYYLNTGELWWLIKRIVFFSGMTFVGLMIAFGVDRIENKSKD